MKKKHLSDGPVDEKDDNKPLYPPSDPDDQHNDVGEIVSDFINRLIGILRHPQFEQNITVNNIQKIIPPRADERRVEHEYGNDEFKCNDEVKKQQHYLNYNPSFTVFSRKSYVIFAFLCNTERSLCELLKLSSQLGISIEASFCAG